MADYKTVAGVSHDTIYEKKSEFIGYISHAKTERDAQAFLASVRKKHYDARHACYAYIIKNEKIERQSDDGEPQKTAGMPILEVLRHSGIEDAIIVVVRYFGGTLLGTGGLVRAYQSATKAGLEACTIADKQYGIPVSVVTDYNSIGKLQYIVAQMELFTQDTLYTDIVTLTVLTTPDTRSAFIKKVTEATSGKAEITEQDPVWFCIIDNSPVFFSE